MHTCSPPSKAIDTWLDASQTMQKGFGHLLLQANISNNANTVQALRKYFESAHLDAREVIHADAGLDLHPDSNGGANSIKYPGCLPLTTLKGLFGEVLSGLFVENYQQAIVGRHPWSVPVFLFRFHTDASDYFYTLIRDPSRKRTVFGRPGDDFIGICLDGTGAISRFIAGEAKWRGTLQPSNVNDLLYGEWIDDPKNPGKKVRSNKGIIHDLNFGLDAPKGLRQMQQILKEKEPNKFANAILSLDKILAAVATAVVPRTNLVLIVGQEAQKRKPSSTLMPVTKPAEYTSTSDLQFIELVLKKNDEQMISDLYNALWSTT